MITKNTNLNNLFLHSQDQIIRKSFDGKIIDVENKKISLQGPFVYPGDINYFQGINLSDILREANLIKDIAYPLFGIIKRRQDLGSIPNYITFSPSNILDGTEDKNIKPFDEIILFSEEDMEEIIFETYEEVSDKDISGTRQDEKQNFDNDNNSDVTSKQRLL